MADKMKLEIVTPYGLVYSEEVNEVTALGTEGEFGALPEHAPFITTLKAGRLTCRTDQGPVYFFVGSGYAEVGPEKVLVMADSAEKAEDIDVERAHEARKRAEERLRQQEEIDFIRAESALERAAARIHVSELHTPR